MLHAAEAAVRSQMTHLLDWREDWDRRRESMNLELRGRLSREIDQLFSETPDLKRFTWGQFRSLPYLEEGDPGYPTPYGDLIFEEGLTLFEVNGDLLLDGAEISAGDYDVDLANFVMTLLELFGDRLFDVLGDNVLVACAPGRLEVRDLGAYQPHRVR